MARDVRASCTGKRRRIAQAKVWDTGEVTDISCDQLEVMLDSGRCDQRICHRNAGSCETSSALCDHRVNVEAA